MIQYEVALEQLEIFVLILMRIASFIYVAPFLIQLMFQEEQRLDWLFL